MATRPVQDYQAYDDLALARLVAARDPDAVRLVTQRNNQRLFRMAWGILKDRTEAQDAVQSAYLRAFVGIGKFEGRSTLATWLARIVINEALARNRSSQRQREQLRRRSVFVFDEYREKLMRGSMSGMAPDADLARQDIRTMLEKAIARLPTQFRMVFILREIEGLSVEETAATLDILPATVKTRYLRARRRLQQELAPELKATLSGTFPFAGADCAAMTERIVERLCARPIPRLRGRHGLIGPGH